MIDTTRYIWYFFKSIVTSTYSSYSELREDINNIIKEWLFGTEDMFDNEDLECMVDDIMKIINKKYQLQK